MVSVREGHDAASQRSRTKPSDHPVDLCRICGEEEDKVSAAHHRLVQRDKHETESSIEGYGTFQGDTNEDGVSFTSTVVGSHELCALMLLAWSLWLQSVSAAVLLLASFLAFFFEPTRKRSLKY